MDHAEPFPEPPPGATDEPADTTPEHIDHPSAGWASALHIGPAAMRLSALQGLLDAHKNHHAHGIATHLADAFVLASVVADKTTPYSLGILSPELVLRHVCVHTLEAAIAIVAGMCGTGPQAAQLCLDAGYTTLDKLFTHD